MRQLFWGFFIFCSAFLAHGQYNMENFPILISNTNIIDVATNTIQKAQYVVAKDQKMQEIILDLINAEEVIKWKKNEQKRYFRPFV